jgi:hypothetical protein
LKESSPSAARPSPEAAGLTLLNLLWQAVNEDPEGVKDVLADYGLLQASRDEFAGPNEFVEQIEATFTPQLIWERAVRFNPGLQKKLLSLSPMDAVRNIAQTFGDD